MSVVFPALAALMAAIVLAFGRATSIGIPPCSTTLRKNNRIAVLVVKPTDLSTAAASVFKSSSTRERTSTVNMAHPLSWICSYIVALSWWLLQIDAWVVRAGTSQKPNILPKRQACRGGRNTFNAIKTFCRIDRQVKKPAQTLDIKCGKRAAGLSICDKLLNRAWKMTLPAKKSECFQVLANLPNVAAKNLSIARFREFSTAALLLW